MIPISTGFVLTTCRTASRRGVVPTRNRTSVRLRGDVRGIGSQWVGRLCVDCKVGRGFGGCSNSSVHSRLAGLRGRSQDPRSLRNAGSDLHQDRRPLVDVLSCYSYTGILRGGCDNWSLWVRAGMGWRNAQRHSRLLKPGTGLAEAAHSVAPRWLSANESLEEVVPTCRATGNRGNIKSASLLEPSRICHNIMIFMGGLDRHLQHGPLPLWSQMKEQLLRALDGGEWVPSEPVSARSLPLPKRLQSRWKSECRS